MPVVTLQIKVKPRAKASSLEQANDGTWVARLRAPPVDGKANEELVALVAKHFHCRTTAVLDQGWSVGPHETSPDPDGLIRQVMTHNATTSNRNTAAPCHPDLRRR